MDYRKTVYEVSDQTIKSNRTDIRLFENFIDNNHHEKIDGPVVMDFQYYLKKDRKNSGKSINRKIFTLRSYSHFIRLKEVPQSDELPFYDVLKIREGYRNRPDSLTTKQLKTLFDAIDRNTCIGIRDYALYALMYLVGLRVGEVHALNIDSIDLKNRILRVIGKGNKVRDLHITEELFQVISEYLAVRPCFHKSSKTKALFVSKKGNRLSIRTMEDNFKKLVNRSGLTLRFTITCHSLRHTFASHLNDKEVDMLVIQSLMGHASSRSTEPYIHPSYKRIKDAIERLPGVIFMNNLLKEGGVNLSFQGRYRKKE
ncbi:MAG: tyrosine-type recombinase/integrase [Deltaproteobacteria bacterium]|nr:tyrosine-type recombinase/integrase [Deltaproteobacteria bacterium]